MIDKNIAITTPDKSRFTFPMWENGATPQVGDWFFATKEDFGSDFYSEPHMLSGITKFDCYELGVTVSKGMHNGLGIDMHNLRHFRWYRPRNKLTILIKPK